LKGKYCWWILENMIVVLPFHSTHNEEFFLPHCFFNLEVFLIDWLNLYILGQQSLSICESELHQISHIDGSWWTFLIWYKCLKINGCACFFAFHISPSQSSISAASAWNFSSEVCEEVFRHASRGNLGLEVHLNILTKWV
jgi:hypothetical protein